MARPDDRGACADDDGISGPVDVAPTSRCGISIRWRRIGIGSGTAAPSTISTVGCPKNLIRHVELVTGAVSDARLVSTPRDDTGADRAISSATTDPHCGFRRFPPHPVNFSSGDKSSIAAMNDPFSCARMAGKIALFLDEQRTWACDAESCGGARRAPVQNSRMLAVLDDFWGVGRVERLDPLCCQPRSARCEEPERRLHQFGAQPVLREPSQRATIAGGRGQ